jgi:hypothetical protein
MGLNDENGGLNVSMPVAPAYGNGGGFGFGGGDWSWIVILFLFGMFGGGWGGMGGFGGGLGFDFPWLLNGQNGINNTVNDGFRDAQLSDSITSVRDSIGSISTQLCGGFAGVNAAITGAQNSIVQQLNTNEIASLNRSFAEQTANTAGFTATNAGIADLRYTLATEACATRSANAANTQSILDKLCQLELDGYKRENDALRSQLSDAKFAASQAAQNAFIQQGFSNEVDQLYNRLSSCPVPSTPVYGRTPIFTCNNGGCGCGCSG